MPVSLCGMVFAAALASVCCVLGHGFEENTRDDGVDQQWQEWLDEPPLEALELAAELTARADVLAANISGFPAECGQKLESDATCRVEACLSWRGPTECRESHCYCQEGHCASDDLKTCVEAAPLGEVDLVCSGGGDLNAYYLGMEMVLGRVEQRTSSLRRQRRGGASGGGWITFELALKGENRTLASYLSYGLLQEAHPVKFSTIATTVLLQDHHWRMLAQWQADKWSERLADLDERVFLALDCGWLTSELKIVSRYVSPEQAASAFIATGAISETYQGDLCADGSPVSGADMTPLFQDQVRPQLIVNLMETGFKTLSMGGGKFTSKDFLQLVQRGQDEAAEYLRTRTVKRNNKVITVCPVGVDVAKNVCKKEKATDAMSV